MKVALVFSVLVGAAFAGVPWLPEPQTQQEWMEWDWMERHEANKNYSATNGDNINVLFYGDSITEGWDYTGRSIWDTAYAPLGAANYGIGGDRTEHVLWRIINGEVQNLSPKLCILKIGTNNVGTNSESDIARGIATIIYELRSKIPSMKILVLGILPRNNAETTNFVERINQQFSLVDDNVNIRYLNMGAAYYIGNGQFYTDLFTEDLLHLSPAGYTKWHDTMESLFMEMWA